MREVVGRMGEGRFRAIFVLTLPLLPEQRVFCALSVRSPTFAAYFHTVTVNNHYRNQCSRFTYAEIRLFFGR
jgi:hypothetical protein